MAVKTIASVRPPFPFDAYSHVVSPIAKADRGGFIFTMPYIPGAVASLHARAAQGQGEN